MTLFDSVMSMLVIALMLLAAAIFVPQPVRRHPMRPATWE
jgi:hypothetical protein